MVIKSKIREEIIPTVYYERFCPVSLSRTVGLHHQKIIGEDRFVGQQKGHREDLMTYMGSLLPGRGRVLELFYGK